MFYFTKTPKWVKKLFAHSIWEVAKGEKAIYLTFDDGPNLQVTPFVLEELRKYNAKASFFCIGKNVAENPLLYNRILEEGHAVGNHTFDHLDGWKTTDKQYLSNIEMAKKFIDSDLFRPPYGRISRNQHKALTGQPVPYKIVMWSVLSGDFNVHVSPEQCCKNVLKNTKSGSIVVFHDSDKANERMRYTLPVVLKYFSEKGYVFKKITGEH